MGWRVGASETVHLVLGKVTLKTTWVTTPGDDASFKAMRPKNRGLRQQPETHHWTEIPGRADANIN